MSLSLVNFLQTLKMSTVEVGRWGWEGAQHVSMMVSSEKCLEKILLLIKIEKYIF